MKLSVSLSSDEVAAVDAYARTTGLASRSAVIQHAIRLLEQSDLERDYEAAWEEWEASGEQAVWAGTASDEMADAAR